MAQALRYVISLAYRYKVYLPHESMEDIASIASLAVVECLDKAITKDRPIAFLCGCARIAVVDYVYRHSSLITKPWDQQPIPICPIDEQLIESLEALSIRTLPQEEEERLYRAINRLTPIQQEVITVQFKLFGHHDDSLHQLHKRNGKKPGYYHKMIGPALKRLHKYITEEGEQQTVLPV